MSGGTGPSRVGRALKPADLRSLDAIHLASAEQLGMDLRVFVTYDERMASAAAGRGLRVIQPA